MKAMKKREGFAGEEAIVLPQAVLQECEKHPLISSLYITDIGYYPRAQYHYRERPHGSPQHILIYCVDGKGGVQINGKRYTINTLEYLIVPAGSPHIYWADAGEPWSIYWLHFKGGNAGAISNILYRKMLNGDHYIKYNEELLKIFHSIYENFRRGYSIDNLIFNSLSLPYYLSSFIDQEKFNLGKNKAQDSIDQAIGYLRARLSQTLTLKDIAVHVHLSVSHFSSLFHKKTGFSPIEYFNHLKMQKACQLLQFSQLRISEVAEEVGIDDPYYFSRLFSSVMGISPRAYRDKKEIKTPLNNPSV